MTGAVLMVDDDDVAMMPALGRTGGRTQLCWPRPAVVGVNVVIVVVVVGGVS